MSTWILNGESNTTAGLRKATRIIHTVDREMNPVNENGKVAGYSGQVTGVRWESIDPCLQQPATCNLPPGRRQSSSWMRWLSSASFHRGQVEVRLYRFVACARPSTRIDPHCGQLLSSPRSTVWHTSQIVNSGEKVIAET